MDHEDYEKKRKNGFEPQDSIQEDESDIWENARKATARQHAEMMSQIQEMNDSVYKTAIETVQEIQIIKQASSAEVKTITEQNKLVRETLYFEQQQNLLQIEQDKNGLLATLQREAELKQAEIESNLASQLKEVKEFEKAQVERVKNTYSSIAEQHVKWEEDIQSKFKSQQLKCDEELAIKIQESIKEAESLKANLETLMAKQQQELRLFKEAEEKRRDEMRKLNEENKYEIIERIVSGFSSACDYLLINSIIRQYYE